MTLIHPLFQAWHQADIEWASAQMSVLNHCMATYGGQTDWLASWDVDEYLNFNGQRELSDLPHRNRLGRWTYIANRYLAMDRMKNAASIIIARANFCNWGAEGKLSHLVGRQVIREPHDSAAAVAQKTLLHPHYKSDHIAFEGGGHTAKVRKNPPPAGINPWHVNVLGDFKMNAERTSDTFNDWPRDHLVLNHCARARAFEPDVCRRQSRHGRLQG